MAESEADSPVRESKVVPTADLSRWIIRGNLPDCTYTQQREKLLEKVSRTKEA
jgi:hypothetical protein